MALRVPTPNVSLVDLVVDLNRDVTIDEINEAFIEAAENEFNRNYGIYKRAACFSRFHN